MLAKEELLELDAPPLIKNVSLELYKEFSIDYLLARKFIYHFSDGSKINIEFTEWGIYHMLSIQHINNRIKNSEFFQKIDEGLTFDDFRVNDAVKVRFKEQKKRISMFACTYNTLRKGQAFYIPSGKVKNTNSVKVDYILYRILDNNNGMNIGIRQEADKFVPLTILISKQSSLMNYIDVENFKLVEKLEITDMQGNMVETISYAVSKTKI
ncbi:MAG: hypothetical protein NC433_11545 [Clostridiales bacterium]|nr:hypothetical protein [Clostridiales bacterium]